MRRFAGLAVRLKADMLDGCEGQGAGPWPVACVEPDWGPAFPEMLWKLVLLLRSAIVKFQKSNK